MIPPRYLRDAHIHLAEHGAALVLYARAWCDSPEDVVQEALLRLVSQRQRPERLVPWLYRVVRNGAISAARRRRRRRERERRASEPLPWFEANDSVLDAQEAAAALAVLPVDLSEVVVARIWGELTFAEIGQILDTSPNTAASRYQYAIAKLTRRLSQPMREVYGG